jgi:hypothetical protein
MVLQRDRGDALPGKPTNMIGLGVCLLVRRLAVRAAADPEPNRRSCQILALCMSDFSQRGWIRLERKGMVIAESERLAGRARSNPLSSI